MSSVTAYPCPLSRVGSDSLQAPTARFGIVLRIVLAIVQYNTNTIQYLPTYLGSKPIHRSAAIASRSPIGEVGVSSSREELGSENRAESRRAPWRPQTSPIPPRRAWRGTQRAAPAARFVRRRRRPCREAIRSRRSTSRAMSSRIARASSSTSVIRRPPRAITGTPPSHNRRSRS